MNIEHKEALRKQEFGNLSAILNNTTTKFDRRSIYDTSNQASLPSPVPSRTISSAQNMSSSSASSSCDVQHGDPSRRSPFPMVSMAQAMSLVLSQCKELPSESIPLSQALHRYASEDVLVTQPFPPFPVSIMDGYAIRAPIFPGRYPIQSTEALAGGSTALTLTPGAVMYITTGAKIPAGANAVVKIEDTRAVPGNDQEVEIAVSVERVGANIRQVGSDIQPGECLVQKGSLLTPIQIGLCATYGISQITCSRRPIVGVLSTGSELFDTGSSYPGRDKESSSTSSCIRDSNRPTLLASLQLDLNIQSIDYGIVSDDEESLRSLLLSAAMNCDVVMTSGGVSMGSADLVKPLLQELGRIHFGRLNMKPGKPTTFATLDKTDGTQCFFFGLPGENAS